METFRSTSLPTGHDQRNESIHYTWVDLLIACWFGICIGLAFHVGDITDAIVAWVG